MPSEEEFCKFAKAEYSYDAWGRLRNPATHVAYAPGSEPPLFLARGYTGHEHLPWFGLINMNARLYDAALGRFLSPDPYVQMPDFSQNFNRYSYCLNNPLLYVDESGEWFLIDDLVAAFIGGAINLTVNLIQGNVTSFWHGAALFGNGFASGAASLYISPMAGAAMMSAGNSALNQGFTSGWSNIDWGQVGISGTMGGATSYLGGVLGNTLSKPIGNLTSNIASPVLREAATQSATNAVTGFTLSTGLALGAGSSLEEALQQGGQGALMGGGIGAMTGTVAGFKYAHDNKISPWNGKSNTVNSGTHSVYEGLDPNTGEVKYVGRTERDPSIRWNEHNNSGTERAGLDYRTAKGGLNLNKIDSKVMEQNLINRYGLGRNGGQLYNKINSISPKNWYKYDMKY